MTRINKKRITYVVILFVLCGILSSTAACVYGTQIQERILEKQECHQPTWSDTFDSYPEGPLNGQGEWDSYYYTIWPKVYVVSEQNHSNPHSCRIEARGGAQHNYSGYTTGIWRFTTWQYIPEDASGGHTWFLLWNRDNSVSTFLEFDPNLHIVKSREDGAILSLQQGEWVELCVVIDLDHDVQHIFYNDQLLSSKSWTEGVGDDGDLNIHAVQMHTGMEGEFTMYYDDMVLTPGIHGDVDADGDVDSADLLILLAAWGNTEGPEDVNGDGIVNTEDLLILLGNWE
jgi:hypothetical protein